MKFREILFCLFLIPFLTPVCAIDAVLLNNRTSISLKGNNLITEYSHEILINNSKGERFTTVSIPYSKLNKISKLQAYITDVNGTILQRLNSGDIKKQSLLSDAAFFQDRMELVFSLQTNRYPYILHYSYTEQQSQFLYINRWVPVIDPTIETRSAELVLQVPTDYVFTVDAQQVEQPSVIESKGTKIYTWKTRFAALSDPEIFAPALISLMPDLKIVPAGFRFEKNGSFDSWTSYGQWQYCINNELQQIPEQEKQYIQTLLQKTADTLEMVRAIYHYIQDRTRYVNISIETGGMIPVASHLVSQYKYGDCKGLSNYMMALLRVAGIPSHYTDVHGGLKIYPINTDFPAQQFNHVILTVPLSSDTLWLDCTSKGPFNYQGVFIQNRPALLMENGSSRIVNIPALKPADVLSTRNILIRRDSAGMNELQVNSIYRGDEFETLSEIHRSVSASNKQKYLRDYFGIKNSDADQFKIGVVHRDSVFASLSFNARTTTCIEKVGTELHLKPVAFKIPSFRKPAYRSFPVQIDYPVCLSDTQTFIIPEVDFANLIIADVCIETAYGTYVKKINNSQSGQLKVTKLFVLNAASYSLAEYSDFYNFVNKAIEADNSSIIIKTPSL